MQIPKALMKAYGHVDCGLYCEVLGGGILTEGLQITIESKTTATLGIA